jgi:aspartyl-tRNA(Asn)/glutamyl-tRNA(Gln) amidotransferase subunit A
MATTSIGTQTGGSITGPSNAQGLTGLKPTMGRASIYGVIPLTYTRDHPGPLARSAMDAAIMMTAMAGPDENDPRTLGLPDVPDLIRAARPFQRAGRVAVRERTRLGVIPGYVSGGAASLRQDFLDTMAGIDGVEIVDVTLPDEWNLLTGTFNAVRLPERTEPFIGMLKEDLTQFGVSLTSWLQGLFLSGDEWITGQRAKVVLLQRILDDVLEQCDVVVQTSPVPFDIVGLPELALPIGFGTSGGSEVPVGTILGAGPYEEDRLLSVAAAYQAVTDHHWRRPADPEPSAVATAVATPHLTPEDVVELTE